MWYVLQRVGQSNLHLGFGFCGKWFFSKNRPPNQTSQTWRKCSWSNVEFGLDEQACKLGRKCIKLICLLLNPVKGFFELENWIIF